MNILHIYITHNIIFADEKQTVTFIDPYRLDNKCALRAYVRLGALKEALMRLKDRRYFKDKVVKKGIVGDFEDLSGMYIALISLLFQRLLIINK